MNFKQVIARKKKAEAQIKEHLPNLKNESGIYVFKRTDEAGIKYAYVGQAKRLLNRLAQHLMGYQHIDLSIRKHGLYEVDKPYGYVIVVYYRPEEKLDEEEQKFIHLYATSGFQLRNKTAGGQGEGKTGLDNQKPSRGYRDGLAQGEKNAFKKIKVFFEKYLDYSIKGKPNQIKLRKMQEFEDYLHEKDEEAN